MTQTVGQRLKAEREERRLTLEKVFEATRIRVQYLQALEADDMSVMPSVVQARGYLRNYAEFLGLEVDHVLNEVHAVSMRADAGEVTGPPDEFSLPRPAEVQPSVPVATPVQETIEASAPAVDSAAAEPEPRPSKPKPARRKKADASLRSDGPAAAVVEPATKRRARKKAQPEPVPVLELGPETLPLAESIPQSAPLPLEEERLPTAQPAPEAGRRYR